MEKEENQKLKEGKKNFISDLNSNWQQNFIFNSSNGFLTTGAEIFQSKNTLTYKFKKLLKDFIMAYLFKSFFRISRSLDKSWNNTISFEKTLDNLINFSNVKFGIFIIAIKILFKMFRLILRLTGNGKYLEYKRLNFVFGVIGSFILQPLGKNNTLTFLASGYFLLKNILSFYNSYSSISDRRIYKESKNFNLIGFALGFILMDVLKKENRSNIKIIKYFLG